MAHNSGIFHHSPLWRVLIFLYSARIDKVFNGHLLEYFTFLEEMVLFCFRLMLQGNIFLVEIGELKLSCCLNKAVVAVLFVFVGLCQRCITKVK